jgi:isopentenyl diphosphate isomerase/L-lactate dehydrogenase-like FMN-dependent dehydrogenase
MTADEAMIAQEAGAQAIVVSNHGGRVLDHTPGTAEVLPQIAKLVKGRIKIMVDGGVRSGVDVLKMLALGADAVMIGRPIAIAAVGGGADGVAQYLDKIRSELTSAMIMTGCATINDISPRILTS